MSRTVELEPPVCDYCGGYILEDNQHCPARDDGRCWPMRSVCRKSTSATPLYDSPSVISSIATAGVASTVPISGWMTRAPPRSSTSARSPKPPTTPYVVLVGGHWRLLVHHTETKSINMTSRGVHSRPWCRSTRTPRPTWPTDVFDDVVCMSRPSGTSRAIVSLDDVCCPL